MPKIQIDEAVYAFLKKAARPFEEPTPNDVLRRLLLGEDGDASGRMGGAVETPSASSPMLEEYDSGSLEVEEESPDPREPGAYPDRHLIQEEGGYEPMLEHGKFAELQFSDEQLAKLEAAGVQLHRMASRPRTRRPVASTDSFVKRFLEEKFSGEFKRVGRYRYMVQSDSQIVYFQNFNKAGSPNLWYRLKHAAMETLRKSSKEGFVCLTNPAERLAYRLPLQSILERTKHLMGEDLEVNIDHSIGRWRELNWSIERYLVRLEGNES